jgi:tetratricopeptide (TPR) repeat protein
MGDHRGRPVVPPVEVLADGWGKAGGMQGRRKMEEAEVDKRLVGWFCWLLDCGFEDLARRSGFNEKTLRLWAKGKNPLRRAHVESLASVAGLTMPFIDAVVLPSLETWRLGKVNEQEVLHDLAGLARDLETSVAGLGRSAVAELVGHVEAWPGAERVSAAELCVRLKDRSAAELGGLVEAFPELHTRELAELMAYASVEVATDDAGRAVAVAQAAHRIGELAGGEGAERWAVEGLTLALLANALRVANDLKEADAVFTCALARWEEAAAAGEVLLPRWRLLGFEASLRRCQRKYPEALASLVEAEVATPLEGMGRVLAHRAEIMVAMGDSEAALAVLREAEPLTQIAPEPRLRLTVLFNTGSLLVDLGRYEEAERHWPAIQAAVVPGKALDENLMIWLRARIDAGLGRAVEAREGFDRARHEYEKRAMAANYAVVSLERAVLDLKEGRFAEVRELADEMAWIFKSKGLHDEALAALTLFRTAAKREALTVELAERMVRYLYRAQHDPKLKFEK